MSVKNILAKADFFEKLAMSYLKTAADEEKKEPEKEEVSPEKELLLPINQNQVDHSVDEKITQIVDIDPNVFLYLTTPENYWVHNEFEKFIGDEYKPLEFFQSPEIQKGMSVHPFLNIDKGTGKVSGHEGRHRAFAVAKAGGKWFRIGLRLKPESRNYKPQDMPRRWIAEFTDRKFVEMDKLIAIGKLRIINDNVQKQYQRDK